MIDKSEFSCLLTNDRTCAWFVEGLKLESASKWGVLDGAGVEKDVRRESNLKLFQSLTIILGANRAPDDQTRWYRLEECTYP